MAVEENPDAGMDSCEMMQARELLTASLQRDPGQFKGQVSSLLQPHSFL
jgi:hypothetical protein